MATPRKVEKFTSSDGSTYVLTFPLEELEWESKQGLRIALAPAAGFNYAVDLLRDAVAPVTVRQGNVRALVRQSTSALVDSTVDGMLAIPRLIGKGKLWTLGADGTRRWAWSRMVNSVDMQFLTHDVFERGIRWGFVGLSDWFAETITTPAETAITTNPQTFTVNNPGNIPVDLMTIRLRANSATGITNPVVENITNVNDVYSFSSTRDLTNAAHELKIDTDALTVGYSTDDGANYTNDLANFSRGGTHANFFRLWPGNNSIRISGTGSIAINVGFSFYAAYGS